MSQISAKVKVKDLVTKREWYETSLQLSFREFIEYIISKYNISIFTDVIEYAEKDYIIYAIIPTSAFKVKPVVSREEQERELIALEMIGGLLTPASQREVNSNPVISLFVSKMRIAIPAGSFEEKTLNNHLCYAKYVTDELIAVACT